MELRRALLLFAIVLGVAAVVAALAGRSSTSDRDRTTVAPAAPAGKPAPPPERVRLDGRGAPAVVPVQVGRATTVVVAVEEPGQVQIEGLGLTEAAERSDPAVFEVLTSGRGRYDVLFTPSGGVRARLLGKLVSRLPK